MNYNLYEFTRDSAEVIKKLDMLAFFPFKEVYYNKANRNNSH